MIRKNTEPRISSYLHGKGIRLGLPIGGTFELTARCNFDCPMCYVHLKQADIDAQGRELTAQQWLDIAQQARDAGMVFALLTGGEPLVRRDFFDIYGPMKKMGLLLSINSNGSLLEGEIRERLVADPPFRVNISLYGGSSETYERMCGRPVFDRVIANIAALKDAGVEVRLNVSITPQNRQDIGRIFAIARDMELQSKATSYMYPSIRVNGGQYGCGSRLSAEEAAVCAVEWDVLRFTREEFSQRARNMKALQAVDEPECSADLDEGVRCRAGRSAFWMTWDGRMLPCGMMPGPAAYPLESGFAAAWESTRRQTAEIRMPGKCTVCPKRAVCAVCPAVCVTETGKYEQVPDYVCRLTDATVRETWKAYQERGGDSHED